jgi:hypothetical protein
MMPVKGNILYCPVCNHAQSQINLTNCENCKHDLGAPNVNVVSTDDELTALQNRYNNARDYCVKNGTEDALNKFEDFFNRNVKAVKNLPFEILTAWLGNSGDLKSYHRAVEEGIRPIANLFNDRKRNVIDSYLYGTPGRDINFAALTLNDKGLDSYGTCRIILNDDSIKLRSSTLEENSYNFVKTHNINLETLDIPAGYRSSWNNKIKLAVAKIYKNLALGSEEKDFSNSVLLSTGNQDKDEFIEVHIYKELSNLAIKTIFVPTPRMPDDKVYVEIIEENNPGKVIRV